MLTLSTSVCVKPAQNHSESGQKGAPSFSEIGEQYIIKTWSKGIDPFSCS